MTQATTPLDGLLAALRLSLPLGGDAHADAQLLAQVADLDALAALATRHQVRGLLLRAGEQAAQGNPSGPLAVLAEKLREDSAAPGAAGVVRSAMGQLFELRRLATSLDACEVPFLVLKGLPLAQRLYGDPFVRRAVDIDLLVAPESFAPARQAVLAVGFRRAKSFDETPVRRRWAQLVRKEETFLRNAVRLELHRRILGNPHYFDAPFADCHERRAWVTVGGDRYPTLAPEDDLLYLMCHGAGHGWRQLKWLCDVALHLRHSDEAELARAAARCERAGISAVWSSALVACRALGVAPPGADVLADWRGRAVARMLPEMWRSGRWPPFGRKVALRVALKPSLRFAAHELARLVVVPEDWQRVNLPDRLFYLYFFLRPWLYAVDALQAAKPAAPCGERK